MNDREKALIYLQMLHTALGYLRVVLLKEDPDKCALPLTAWMKNATEIMERINNEQRS